ncbi:hypothetical protein LCGC14_2602140, partial [marine sediment metagenome]
LDGGNPVLELNLIFAHSAGVTPYVNGQEWKRGDRDTQGLVEFRDGEGNVLWWFNLPRSWDSEGNEQLGTFRFKKQGNSLYVSHRVPLSFVQGAVYPLFVDVTVDEQVAASLDDVRHTLRAGSTHAFATNSTFYAAGNDSANDDDYTGDARFTTVAIADTINVAYLTLTAKQDESGTIVRTNISAEDADDPGQVTDDTDFHTRTQTTAVVTWDSLGSWTTNTEDQSPSIVAVLQEIVDRGGWASGNAINIRWQDDGADSDALRVSHSYDSDTAKAPKLHIEYTAGGVTTRRYSLTTLGVG